MKKIGYCFFVIAAGLSFFPLHTSAEGEAVKFKIISAPQTIEAGAVSAIFTIESQDAGGVKTNVSTTTYASLLSSSATGKFASSPVDGPCGSDWTVSSVTIAKNTSHKSFCYKDETVGAHTITVSAPAQPAILSDSQEIIITAPLPPQDSTTTQETTSTTTPDTASSTPESLSQSFKVKIFSFLPNPSGDDAGKEWVEIKNQDEKDILLDGWLLDDKNTGEGPADNALALSGVIASGETKRFVLPPGAFALNNSGGDEINLYFSDKSPSDKAVYTQTAYDDGIFEFREGVWQQPARDSGSGSGGTGSTVAPDFTYSSAVAFKLNEIFPNPLGDDTGKEWVEIFNPNNATATLEGYFLADGDSDTWSASAWEIPKGTFVSPLGLVAIALPKDAFSLNNTGKEKVKLFSLQKQPLDSVVYENAPENKSWAKNKENKWEWSIPSFGAPNDQTPELLKIFISEILPQPDGDEEEFVELANFATTTVNLEGAILRIGSRGKTFEASASIEPNGFLAIYEDDLPARLRNSGQTVKLFDAFGRLISEAVYPKAQAGKAFASLDGKNYSWTSSLTPGEENQFVLGETVMAQGQTEGLAQAGVKNKTTASGATAAQMSKVLSANKDMQTQLAQMQESIDQLQATVNSQGQPEKTTDNQPPASVQKKTVPFDFGRAAVWGFGMLFLAGMIFVVFKYVKL